MNLSQATMILTLTITLVLTACGAETPPSVIPSPTAATSPSSTDAALATVEFVTPIPTFTPTPSPEPTPTNTLVPTITLAPSPTPEPEPMVTVNDTLTSPVNVRAGPGTDYPVVGQLEPGQEVIVTGRNEDNSWWQISLTEAQETDSPGWVYEELVTFSGSDEIIPVAKAPSPLPSPTPASNAIAEAETSGNDNDGTDGSSLSEEELADKLRCGKDFCVTYQAMVPIWENGGCVGNHSIYITVLEGLPPGKPMDGVVIGDTYNNVEVASGSHGPGQTEITLWMNSMILIAKRKFQLHRPR
jgi:hypothetical protein